MANYNSKRTYNKKLTNGGANYNSGPFTIIVLDNGIGLDDIEDVISYINVSDTATADEKVILVTSVEVLDKSIATYDSIPVVNNVNVLDSAIGEDSFTLNANVYISDTGIGNDFGTSVAGAFFVIDSNNILHPLGVKVTRDSQYELLPATRDNTEEVPGRHGEYDFGTEFQAKMLELNVVTNNGYNRLEKAQLQQFFAKYLDPSKGDKTLIFSDDVEKTYNVKYSGRIDISPYATWFPFVIPFKMSDPFIIGSFEQIVVGSGNLINSGTHETGLTIEIQGPSTNPSIIVGGEVLTYSNTIPSGQTLIIDTEKETAKIGNTNAMVYYNGAFPLLYPGEVSVTATSNVTIRWKDKWI